MRRPKSSSIAQKAGSLLEHQFLLEKSNGKNAMKNLNASNFWNTDLEDVEAIFLPKGMKITDLPTTLDDRVPTQGSVILDRVINIDDEVKAPSLKQKILFFIRK